MRREGRPTTKADETPEFIEFWEIWRPYMNINDGRGAARNEFVKHVEEFGVDPRDMVDGARWFIRSGGNQTRDPTGKLIRIHANRWLFKMAYEDFAEMERAFQARQAEARERKPSPPQPKPTAQSAPVEDRAAIARRVFEKHGIPNGEVH